VHTYIVLVAFAMTTKNTAEASKLQQGSDDDKHTENEVWHTAFYYGC
jgi:hypothetical protein